MLMKVCLVSCLFLIFTPLVLYATTINLEQTSMECPEGSTNAGYYPQARFSTYTIENRTITPYPEIITSDQQTSPFNHSLLEKTLNLNLTSPSVEVTFNLPTGDVFLAIDGASQSFVLRVNYSIYYPNGTLATPTITTTAEQPMHFFILSPPIGTWRIVATLIDKGETTAWIQAISYNNGTKMVTELEKLQIHLIAGQNLYFKIPLFEEDWFYLYVNRFAGAKVTIILAQQGSYDVPYFGPLDNYIAQLFTSKSHLSGVYLLKIINFGSTDIFVEIVKTLGIKFVLNVDEGKTIRSRFQVDLEFFNCSIDQDYEWISFDGAVLGSDMTAEYLIIDPNLDIIFDGMSYHPAVFVEHLINYPQRGRYIIGVFSMGYSVETIKITSSASVGSIDYTRLDQKWSFTQSGQTFYLKILQSEKYFLFAGITLLANVKYTLFSPGFDGLYPLWSWGPGIGLAFYPPTKPSVPFYILKIQGETSSSTIIHARFQGLEDYQIATPDCSNYWGRFQGDMIISNVSIRNSDYVLQHTGAFWGETYVGLFDSNLVERWSRTFFYTYETAFQRLRKGHEDPFPGDWLQVVVFSGPKPQEIESPWAGGIEISTLQSGDESGHVITPYQMIEAVEWNNWWQMRSYKVNVDSPNWFGVILQLLSVNDSHPIHPYASIWVYDSELNEHIYGESVDYYCRFRTYFWPNPNIGTWLVVIVGFQHTESLCPDPYEPSMDPLHCSVSYVSDADFHRDWPTNLNGTINSYQISVENKTFMITIQSNSTISNFTFNYSKPELSFNASGLKDTIGFCIVTVPKQLLNRPFYVVIDNVAQQRILSKENSTHFLIFFSYEQGEHQVKIIPEFSLSAMMLPLMAATTPIVIFHKRKVKIKHSF